MELILLKVGWILVEAFFISAFLVAFSWIGLIPVLAMVIVEE